MSERLIASVGEIDELRRRMNEAVRDLPEQPHRPLSTADVEILRGAGLDELAVMAEGYVAQAQKRKQLFRFWRR